MTEKLVKMQPGIAALLNSTQTVADFSEQALDAILDDHDLSNYYLVVNNISYKTLAFPYSRGKREFIETCALQTLNSPLRSVVQDQRTVIVNSSEYPQSCDDPSKISHPPELWVGFPFLKGFDVFACLVFFAEDEAQANILKPAIPFLEAAVEALSPYLQAKIKMDKLEVSEQKFRRFVETSIDITFQVTPRGKVDYISSNIKTRFGINPEALIGRVQG